MKYETAPLQKPFRLAGFVKNRSQLPEVQTDGRIVATDAVRAATAVRPFWSEGVRFQTDGFRF